MPYSNAQQITPIMEEVRRIRPRRMIDVGCGLGVYGMLCRVQLDLYDDESFDKKLFRNGERYKRWDTVIDAIEGFEDYLEFIPRWAYDDILIEDVRTALPKLPDAKYDIALALAIIEHLSKQDGIEFVRQLQRISRSVIVSVPKNVMPQEVAGNDFETHRSQWSQEDFLALGFNKFIPHSGVWIAVHDPDCGVHEDLPVVPAEIAGGQPVAKVCVT
ncbi:MAG: hypothetical protein PHQ14_02125 [Chromatiales bacterium]|nr:hypothetical protein [Chromatiales bacterium]